MLKRPILVLIILSLFQLLNAQTGTDFWKQTDGVPAMPDHAGNTCIAIGPQDEIFVGTLNQGLFKSTDGGVFWNNILPLTDTPVVKIWTNKTGKMLVITNNMLFVSYNQGESWQMNTIPVQYELTDLEVLPNGNIMVSSASIVDVTEDFYDYYGDGVLLSTDDGKTWMKKNTGFHQNLSITNIAVSSDQTIFVSLSSYTHQVGGLYYSKDLGNTWSKLAFPTHKSWSSESVYTATSIYDILCLDIDAEDNIYFSYEGVSKSVAYKAGLVNNIYGVLNNERWQPIRLNGMGYEWQFHGFSSIHISPKNNAIYTSLETIGSVSYGGPHINNNLHAVFARAHQGIQNIDRNYFKMMFTENSKGRVYAIQLFDDRVYYVDTILPKPVTAISEIENQQIQLNVYPNPSISCVNIQSNQHLQKIRVMDVSGKIWYETEVSNTTHQLHLNELKRGVYVLYIETSQGVKQQKLVLH